MKLSDITDIAASGLEAQRVRMVVTASNLANAETTRGPDGGVYRRRDPVFAARPMHEPFAGKLERSLRRVQITRIVEDPREPIRTHQPGHPDADAEGYVSKPRISVVEEMTNMITASRSFEANVIMLRKAREMGEAALSIGR